MNTIINNNIGKRRVVFWFVYDMKWAKNVWFWKDRKWPLCLSVFLKEKIRKICIAAWLKYNFFDARNFFFLHQWKAISENIYSNDVDYQLWWSRFLIFNHECFSSSHHHHHNHEWWWLLTSVCVCVCVWYISGSTQQQKYLFENINQSIDRSIDESVQIYQMRANQFFLFLFLFLIINYWIFAFFPRFLLSKQ